MIQRCREIIKKLQSIQFIRFLFVGGFNTVVVFGLYVVALKIGLYYTIAILVPHIIGSLIKFKTIGVLVFRSHDNKLIGRFILVYIAFYFISIGSIKLILSLVNDWGTWQQYRFDIAGGLTILPISILNYIVNKKFVFRHTSDSEKA